MPSRLTSHLRWVPPSEADWPLEKRAAFPPSEKEASPKENDVPIHEPCLPPREEAVYLLHVAAEVEHALMVQYLYAAFSLGGDQVPAAKRQLVQCWRNTLMSIAREEMAHLATLQNVLQVIGGPITFERQDFPIPTDLYPFDFALQRLTRESLGQYILAERPSKDVIKNAGLTAKIHEIRKRVKRKTPGGRVHAVQAIYTRIGALLSKVRSADFSANSMMYQVDPGEWGLGYPDLLILTASSGDSAQDALKKIAEQGEGASAGPTPSLDPTSHFMRLLNIDDQFAVNQNLVPTRPVATNPTVLVHPGPKQTRITHPQAFLWAHLGNRRYRMLLMYLSHVFHIKRASDSPDGKSPRGLLVSLAFGEMYHLRSIGDILADLPLLNNADGRNAGLPFDLPYSLALPDRETARWRLHRDLLIGAGGLIDALDRNDVNHKSYLAAMRTTDAETLRICATIIGS